MLVQTEQMVHKVPKVRKVQQDKTGRKVHRDPKEFKEIRVTLVTKDRKVHRATKVFKASKASKVQQVKTVPRDLKVFKG